MKQEQTIKEHVIEIMKELDNRGVMAPISLKLPHGVHQNTVYALNTAILNLEIALESIEAGERTKHLSWVRKQIRFRMIDLISDMLRNQEK